MAKAKRQTLSNCRRHPPAAGGGPEVEVEVEAEAEAFTRQQHPHQSQSQSQSQSEAPTSTQYQINTENKFYIVFDDQNMAHRVCARTPADTPRNTLFWGKYMLMP